MNGMAFVSLRCVVLTTIVQFKSQINHINVSYVLIVAHVNAFAVTIAAAAAAVAAIIDYIIQIRKNTMIL